MFLDNPSINKVVDSIENSSDSVNDFAFILLGEQSQIPLNGLVDSLNNRNIKFAGGIFPKVIHNDGVFDDGVILKMISSNTISIYFDSTKTFTHQFEDFISHDFSTAYVLTSGMSSKSSEHLRALYTNLGNDVKFLGGGVGRMNSNENGILISNDGVFNTGTIVALTKKEVSTGSVHGWTKLFGPFIATKTEKNIIKELNWENAFSVYQRFFKESLGIQVDKQNFNLKSIHHPFGIYKENKEYIVRDPIKVSNEGYLQCVGNIPENSLIDLMSIEIKDLKSLPIELVEQSYVDNSTISDALIFDCISRANHLNSNFFIELTNIKDEVKRHQPNVQLEGALSIGEIYSSGEGYPEMLNKSIVLGLSQ